MNGGDDCGTRTKRLHESKQDAIPSRRLSTMARSSKLWVICCELWKEKMAPDNSVSGRGNDAQQSRLDFREPETGPPKRANIRIPTVMSTLSPAKPTEVYDTYWYFAAERQAVF